MKNTSLFYHLLRRLTVAGGIALLSIIGAIVLLSIKMDYLDHLNLDLNGYLTAPEYPFKGDVAEVSLSYLKRGHNGDEGLDIKDVVSALQAIANEKPKAIVLALGTPEMKGDSQAKELFLKESEKIPNLFYYSRWGQSSGGAFNNTDPYITFSRHIGNKYAIDTKLGGQDNKSRRLVLSMNGVDYDDELARFAEVMGLRLPELKQMPGAFKLFNSIQVYFRFYSETSVKDLTVPVESLSKVKDKIVFVGTSDAHSSYLGIHPFSRFEIFSDQTTEHYFSESSYLLTVYANLKAVSYIKHPGAIMNHAWLALVLLVQIILLVRWSERPLIYLCASFGALAVVWIIGVVSFAWFSVVLDFARAALGTILIQYIGVPVLFLKFLRKSDHMKIEQNRYLEQQKVKNRFVLKAARADASLKIAAKISHDIRSPLMALQMATRLVKGQVAEDLEELLRESTLRLQGIADSALHSYKEISSNAGGPSDLALASKELVEAFRKLHPQCQFEINFDGDLNCIVPKYSLQRCLSNLIVNAIEAPAVAGRTRTIQVHGKAGVESVDVVVKDNGPGISDEIAARLFQEGATYGKRSGTGLGLYQVKEELSAYGATVICSSSSEGAVFEISIPRQAPLVTLQTSKNVLVFEDGGDLYRHLVSSGREQINFIVCQSLKEAERHLDRIMLERQEWTVFIDLAINSEDETGLDLLEKIDSYGAVKTILFTSLNDFHEMKNLLDRHRVICISKSRLPYIRFVLKE